MAKVVRVNIDNGPGSNGQGEVLIANDSSVESKGFLIKNLDVTNTVELLGVNDDGSPQLYGSGYPFPAGAEIGIDLGPGESLNAAAAAGVTVVVAALKVRSVDVGG